ncbi:hypothetical protein PoB_000783200 [Plakobranchus ocellatus]|uniref:Uncharacterized protein n=1 Tax=Plakobranchus ocellatus TaxID=259542 RepID=A0AAV3YFV9_9GAST|nr:hypothetical protein PoB_000783200 [Plakobranchus ocellatus]
MKRFAPCCWMRGVGSTVACESALRSAGTLLLRVRAMLPAPWPDGDHLVDWLYTKKKQTQTLLLDEISIKSFLQPTPGPCGGVGGFRTLWENEHSV